MPGSPRQVRCAEPWVCGADGTMLHQVHTLVSVAYSRGAMLDVHAIACGDAWRGAHRELCWTLILVHGGLYGRLLTRGAVLDPDKSRCA